jgi:hypothetical protein
MRLSAARRLVFGTERDLPQMASERIDYALNDKTALMVFGGNPQVTSFGTHNRPNENTLWYFRSDGVLFLNSSPDGLSRANWSIVDDRILHIIFKSRDPDGASRISTRVYPLQGFFESMLDAGDGDYCRIGMENTQSVAYEGGAIVGSSLEQVCEPLSPAVGAGTGRTYPTMDGIAADILVDELFQGVPDYFRNQQFSSEKIADSLVGKTVYTSMAETEYDRSGEALILKTKKTLSVIAYFRGDGRFFLNVSPNLVVSGDWLIANDKGLILRPKVRGLDGRLNVLTWVNPLYQFISSINDSKDGDFCEMESGSTKAFVYSNGKFSSSRLGPTCGRRKRT